MYIFNKVIGYLNIQVFKGRQFIPAESEILVICVIMPEESEQWWKIEVHRVSIAAETSRASTRYTGLYRKHVCKRNTLDKGG